MNDKNLATKAANYLQRMAVMCGKDTDNTSAERVFKQAGYKCAYLHEISNRANVMADVWNIFDHIQLDTIEEEEEMIVRLMAIDNALSEMTEINLVGITDKNVKAIRQAEHKIEENAMAVYCAFDAIINA